MKWFCAYWLLCAVALGQAQDTLQLHEVLKVAHSSNNDRLTNGLVSLESQQGKTLGETLREFSSLYIKSYGKGQLASLALRGTSATQTEIQWNGIRLNSPVLGQVDLSLFTIGMQDEIRLLKTGVEGNIGGVLQLQNDEEPDSGLRGNLTLRYGSFNTFESSGALRYGNGKVGGATRISYLRSDNNFRYRNTSKEGHPWEQETNARVKTLAWIQQFSAAVNAHNSLNLSLWLNEAERQIPPIMSKPASTEQQDDYSLRVLAAWNGHFGNLRTKWTSAFLQDNIRYRNPDAHIDETTVTQAVRNLFSFAYLFPFNLRLSGALNYDYEQADVAAYHKTPHRHTLGARLYAAYYHPSGWNIRGGFREDLANKTPSAFAPELSFGYSRTIRRAHYLSASVSASRNFRFPTFNDLYWIPGGNPQLKQEKSWNGTLSLHYSFQHYFDLQVANFYLYATDWIQWIPNGSLWYAANFRSVFSKGVEVNLRGKTFAQNNPRKFGAAFFASYTYTQAINLDASSAFDQSAGKQLIYVPAHNAVAGIELHYKRFYLRSSNHYTSRLFTATDNSQFLNGYFLTDIEAGKSFSLHPFVLDISFAVRNLSNTNYQSVAQRPMPGRSFEGTLKWNLP